MKPIAKYIEYQLDIFRKECNFSEEELEFFNLKARKKSMVQICQEMNISRTKYYTINKSIKEKMEEVDRLYHV